MLWIADSLGFVYRRPAGECADLHAGLRRREAPGLGSGGTYSEPFEYVGNGKRVKQVLGSTTTYFVGNYYEKTGSTVTKYYYAGGTRIGMRKYTIPQSMVVEYFLGDHLGSTSVTTDTAGAKVSEMRYKPFREVRYTWKDATLTQTTPAYALTKWTFTGQYSYVDDPSTPGVEDFGLLYFNARWLDPTLGRFAQADTIIPGAGNSQAWDRYAFVNNNPVRYTDPNGHMPVEGCGGDRKAQCYASDLEKAIDAQKLVRLQQSIYDGQCQGANSAYCSGWDNWAWDNIPSAIAFNKGIYYQAGFGGEFGGNREVSYVYNWRSLEADTMYTQGHYSYLGTPQLAGAGYYKGVTLIYGASSNASITRNSNGGGGVLALDAGGAISATYQHTIGVDEDGQRVIDRVSGRPIESHQLNLGIGGNLLVNAADAGGTINQGNTQIGSPSTPIENLIFQILRLVP